MLFCVQKVVHLQMLLRQFILDLLGLNVSQNCAFHHFLNLDVTFTLGNVN